MKEYNWDEMELKYFGLEYKIITPQGKAKIMLETIPLESEMKIRALEGALELDNRDATEVYRNLIDIAEGLTEFSDAFEEAKQMELHKKWEFYKK